MLAKTQDERRLHGVAICRRVPCISHLLFADDSLLFCRANQEKVQVISNVLQTYVASSGQCINFEKSSVYFSSNTATEHRERIKETLGVRKVDWFESYLRLPTLVGRAKYQTFSFLKDKVWKKSRVGRDNYCLDQGRKSLSKQWCNLFLHILWGCSSCQ